MYLPADNQRWVTDCFRPKAAVQLHLLNGETEPTGDTLKGLSYDLGVNPDELID